MVAQGITDYEIYTDNARQRIIVRFPWRADESDFDPERAVRELGETYMLTFYEGEWPDESLVIMRGSDVYRAWPSIDPETNRHVVAFELTSEGARVFSNATARLVGHVISIWMDDTPLSAPVVSSRITDGNGVISGSFTREEAQRLAAQINGGALPFRLETDNYNTISPTLGMGARDTMVMAGLIAFILVCVFMLVYYRISGLVTCIVLLGQTSLIIASVTGFLPAFPSFTLTLPGIAGIILSIGMGIDANIITRS
jgi:protein-export membrane protein SecD